MIPNDIHITLDIHRTTQPAGKYPISVMSTTSIKQQLKVYKTITARASRRRRHNATFTFATTQSKQIIKQALSSGS